MPKQKRKTVTTGEGSGNHDVLSNERNWSELPEEILHLFSKKLPDISDFIRFRAVCKTWQLSAPVTDPPPQLPWLLVRHEQENGIMHFYCLSSGKVQTIYCPGSRHAYLNGPAYRNLLAIHLGNSEIYLLNPLTHDQTHVPFINARGSLAQYIGPDQIEGGDIVIISGLSLNANWQPNTMSFWRPGADNWVHVEGVDHDANLFYMGQYFSNDRKTGITNVIDIATKKLAYQVAPPQDTNLSIMGRTIMVESGGKVLRLFQHVRVTPYHFDIHCLYFGDGDGKPCWVKITDIGDHMLFLQTWCGLSLCASNFAEFKGNCIYFLDYTKYRYLCRYDIGEGTTEKLPCPFDSVHTWFVPSLV